jgi:hypothetical protein
MEDVKFQEVNKNEFKVLKRRKMAPYGGEIRVL